MQRFVVDLNLCPFARREVDADRVRYACSHARSESDLLADLTREMQRLDEDHAVATTLLIHPGVLADFFQFNQFLDEVDALLVRQQREGIYQVASFHPHYQYAGTRLDDAENFANRSPWPMLHILREDQVSHAVAMHPDTTGIPQANVATLNAVGTTKLRQMWQFMRDDTRMS